MPVADPQTFDRMKAADLRSDETKYNDERVHKAVAAERERCAKIAEAIDSGRGNEKQIAKAIRAGEC